ncbi:hypothetical protein [Actinobaculum suis]|uniref:DegT/DnrJ/EryC1/StrS aminotransferase family protein n=1 Tax=Actinobaculum suis TaxID=1657 RepID=A0AAW9HKA7_9ACTO|nr:hypothetical protein [Actinobaculum suis]MDY5154081.1 hypothetical protein [Actinobaculum suis]
MAGVASGRQGISLLAQTLRDLGVRRVGIASFACWTMVEPWELEGIGIDFLPVGADLLPCPRALAEYPGPAHALFFATVFGIQPGSALRRELAAFRSRGGAIALDLTHEALTHKPLMYEALTHEVLTSETFTTAAPPHEAPAHEVLTSETPAPKQLTHKALQPQLPDYADFAVASLRKWLPIPDGAWVAGPGITQPLSRSSHDAAVTSRTWQQICTGQDCGAEALVDQALTPAPLSEISRGILRRLDTRALLERRLENSRALRAALKARIAELVNPGARGALRFLGDGRFAVVIDLPVPATRALQYAQTLAAQGVYSPAFWPPVRNSLADTWPAVLALPIDQRYTPADMQVLARRVVRALHDS